MRDEDNFAISGVKLYGAGPASFDVRIDTRQLNGDFRLRAGASLVWVIQTTGVHRIDQPFSIPKGAREFTIADHVMLDFGDSWPVEIYLAERWSNTGYRRISNSIRLNTSDVQAGTAPRGSLSKSIAPGLNYRP